MRNPEFGNKFKLVRNTKVHRTFGGNLHTFQAGAPMWEGFSVSFKALSLTEMTTLRDWIIQNVAQIVTLTDFEGRIWTGIIVSDDINILNGKNLLHPALPHTPLGCNYEISFDFEGQVTALALLGG